MNIDVYSKHKLELTKSNETDSGFDLRSSEDVELTLTNPRKAVATGIHIDMMNYSYMNGFTLEAQIRPRSGLAFKQGLTVVNSPGTIDNSFKGELKVILLNTGNDVITIKKGDRIAQLVYTDVNLVYNLKEEFDFNSDRGENGFGSTGIQ